MTLRALTGTNEAESLRVFARLATERDADWYPSKRLVTAALDAMTQIGDAHPELRNELEGQLETLSLELLHEGFRHKAVRDKEVGSACTLSERIGLRMSIPLLERFDEEAGRTWGHCNLARRALEVVRPRIEQLPSSGWLTIAADAQSSLSLPDAEG